MKLRQDKIGLVLVVLSSVLFGLSGIFTKLISADTWTILTWRGLSGATLIYIYVLYRSVRAKDSSLRRLGSGWWALALVGSLSSITFIAAFKLTYVANVTVIYALVPFVAAIFEWVILRERIRWQTMLAALVSTTGVCILVFGTLGSGNVIGDILAVAMMLLNAAYVVLVRIFKNSNVVLSGALASFLLFFVGWIFANPSDISTMDLVLTIIFGFSFGGASILWTEGARLLPAAEVGVLSTGDIPIAIFFAWTILSEIPPVQSIIGGSVVLLSVISYSFWKTKAQVDHI